MYTNIFKLYTNRHDKFDFVLGEQSNRVCRFCGDSDISNFNKNVRSAHAIPNSTGNDWLFSYYECNICNQKFGDGIEQHFANCFIRRNIKEGISKKGGRFPRLSAKAGKYSGVCWPFNKDGIILVEHDNNMKTGVVPKDKKVQFKLQRFYSIAVYKCFVKMGLSLLPQEYIHLYNDALLWICEDFIDKDNHTNFYTNNSKLLLKQTEFDQYKLADGLVINLWRRTNNDEKLPYILFQISWAREIFLLELPMNKQGNCKALHELPSLCKSIDEYSNRTLYKTCSNENFIEDCIP